MKVSVLISAFNRAKWLGETIASVLKSDYPHIEIIVRNSSLPPYFEDVERILRLDWRRNGEQFAIKILHGINKNAPHSGNALLREVTEGYVMPLSDDDLIEPTTISRLVELLQTCEMACCQPCFIDANGDPYHTDKPWGNIPPIRNMEREQMRLSMYAGTPFVGAVLFRRSLIDKIGFANELLTNLSDLDMYLRTLKVGEIKVIEEPLYRFRIHESNTSLIPTERMPNVHDELKLIRRRHFGLKVEGFTPTLDCIAEIDPMSRYGWRQG